MFSADDTRVIGTMMAAYFAGNCETRHHCLIDEVSDLGGRVAMAYVELVRATDGTCELLMIAVDPRHQGKGRGAALLRYVERCLVERAQRLLLA
jgi:ribosomal protein S18 acetylase RimI-like enzyme